MVDESKAATPPEKLHDSQAKTHVVAPKDAGPDDIGDMLDSEGMVKPQDETMVDYGQSIGHPSIYATVAIRETDGETLVELAPVEQPPGTNTTTRIVNVANLADSARYDLKDELGRGGMGVVFRAFDKDLRRMVALKISRADRQTGHSHGRFIEEAQVQGQLSHPNIVPVHELGLDPRGRPYFTMKLVEGRSLASVVRALRRGDQKARSEWPLSKRLYVFGQLLNCVAYAHSRGVIHRDLKPDNLMLGDFGEVLLMDWGLARVLKNPENPGAGGLLVDTSRLQTPGDQTLDGAIVGTPAYMPPEQAKGERDKIDERSDIYSLGAILYELLALQPPYSAKTASDLISKVASEKPAAPSVRNKTVIIPRGLENICMKCLETERESRFQSVRELQAALDTWQRKQTESIQESTGFALLGKVLVVAVVTSVFLATALLISGADNVDLRTHLFYPGILSALMTLGFGSLIEWATLGVRNAYDGTRAVLFWNSAGVEGDELRGFFAAEACRRAKWVYMVPCIGALLVAVLTHSRETMIIAVQMCGAGLMCVLAIGLVEQGTYRRLDAMNEVPAQDHRDALWRWVLTFAVIGLGLHAAVLAGWTFTRLPGVGLETRRFGLSVHLIAVLAGVWSLAHIAHPAAEIRHTFRRLFARRNTPEQREEIAPMARQFAANAVIFGAIGSITWIGLHAPQIGSGARVIHFFLGLTPLLAGLIWSAYFRWRVGALNTLKSQGNLVQRRFLAYIDKPKSPHGLKYYLAAWSPLIVGGIASMLVLIWDALM